MAKCDCAPDLQSVLEAYSTLEVENNATPNQIRAAYRTLAYHHHPDRLASHATATDREQATRRMARLNAAYALIREAPLRHHRISTTPLDDWSDAQTELEQILQRARVQRRWRMAGVVVAFAVLSLLLARRFGPVLVAMGMSRPVAGLIILAILGAAWMLRTSRDVWPALSTTVQLLRLFVMR
jgi:hypothetical protein